jgi:hypothetical protein
MPNIDTAAFCGYILIEVGDIAGIVKHDCATVTPPVRNTNRNDWAFRDSPHHDRQLKHRDPARHAFAIV